MTEIYVAVAGVLVFAGIGFQRGWLREVATLGGLLVGWAVNLAIGPPALGLVNRIWLMLRFTAGGGFDTMAPGPLLQQLRQSPLIDPRHPGVLLGLIFLAFTGGSYYAASRWVAGATASASRVLGALVALGNGFLLSYLMLTYLSPVVQTELFDSSVLDHLAAALGDYLLSVLLVGIAVAVGVALVSSGRIGKHPEPRSSSRAARARAPSS